MRVSIVKVPWLRRRQTAAVAAIVFFALGCLLLWFFAIICPIMWWIYIPYLLVAYLDKAPQKGGRLISRMRTSTFWKYFCGYFPAELVFENNWHEKQKENQQYLFAVHPHGVVSLSVWANVLSNGTGFHDKLPSMLTKLRMVTLPINFYIPFWREFLLFMGLINSHEHSIVAALKDGCSVGIVVGGAEEALDAVPNADHKLTLRKRRGFIRLAMKNGCHIVPVFSFGENDLFDQTSHPNIRRIQRFVKKYVGFSTPLFRGRGIFNYDFGLMPYRQQITTIVGKPIKIEKNENPTPEQLNQVHEFYLETLKNLYYSHREKYGSVDRELVFC